MNYSSYYSLILSSLSYKYFSNYSLNSSSLFFNSLSFYFSFYFNDICIVSNFLFNNSICILIKLSIHLPPFNLISLIYLFFSSSIYFSFFFSFFFNISISNSLYRSYSSFVIFTFSNFS